MTYKKYYKVREPIKVKNDFLWTIFEHILPYTVRIELKKKLLFYAITQFFSEVNIISKIIYQLYYPQLLQ